jgi:hypothetical protein
LKEKVMANPFGMGLPNQGLKSLTASATATVLETIPVEFDADTLDLGAGATRDLVATQTVAANRKVTLDSLIVNVPIADAVVRMYRNGTVVEAWTPKTIDQSLQLFNDGIGKEFDEGETWRITITSVGGSVSVAHGSVSGRSEIKRNELFSQILA